MTLECEVCGKQFEAEDSLRDGAAALCPSCDARVDMSKLFGQLGSSIRRVEKMKKAEDACSAGSSVERQVGERFGRYRILEELIDDTGYYLGFGDNWNTRSYISRGEQTCVVVNENEEALIKPGQWQHVAAERKGTRVKIAVDGELINEYDDFFPFVFGRGAVGLYTYYSHAHFDNVRVYALLASERPSPCATPDYLFMNEEYDSAIQYYESIIASFPDSEVKARAKFKQAVALDKTEDSTNQAKACERLAELASKRPDGMVGQYAGYYLARMLARAGSFDDAIEKIDKIARRTTHQQVKLRLGAFFTQQASSLAKQGKYPQATHLHQEALKRDYVPDILFHGSCRWLAAVAMAQGDLQRAVELLDGINVRVPNDVQRCLIASISKAECQSLSGRSEDALKSLDDALAPVQAYLEDLQRRPRDPQDLSRADILLNRSVILGRTGERGKIRKALEILDSIERSDLIRDWGIHERNFRQRAYCLWNSEEPRRAFQVLEDWLAWAEREAKETDRLSLLLEPSLRIIQAHVGLGRYSDAARSCDTLVDLLVHDIGCCSDDAQVGLVRWWKGLALLGDGQQVAAAEEWEAVEGIKGADWVVGWEDSKVWNPSRLDLLAAFVLGDTQEGELARLATSGGWWMPWLTEFWTGVHWELAWLKRKAEGAEGAEEAKEKALEHYGKCRDALQWNEPPYRDYAEHAIERLTK